MTTTKAEFQTLATELIGSEFADFAVSTTVNNMIFVYSTQTKSISQTATLPMVRIDFKQSQYDGQKIKIGDYKLVGERQLLTFTPAVDSCDVIFGGVNVNFIDMEIDAADAVVTMHVRPQ